MENAMQGMQVRSLEESLYAHKGDRGFILEISNKLALLGFELRTIYVQWNNGRREWCQPDEIEEVK